MIKIIVAIFLIPIVGYVLTLFNWPDIDAGVVMIEKAVGYFYSFNAAFPVSEFMTIALLVFGIEGTMYALRVFAKLLHFGTGHKAPTDDAKV